MLVHVLIKGSSSAGKSWTVRVVLRLLPPEASHVIDAGSPRILIYDQADLRHRVIVFSEADSLPAGEDNPAASAIRNLLQDGRLHYSVVVRDPDTRRNVALEIDKPGPSTLITTAARSLGDQLMTRLFTLELAEHPGQIRAALRVQARLEEHGPAEADAAMIAFQSYLQALAPWNVYVPFAERLAEQIGKSASAPRILRDYSRLLSLIKAVAVLRHRHRRVDAQGRIIAEREDYSFVRLLVNQMYIDSSSGAAKGVREAVATVARLAAEKRTGTKITISKVAEVLGVSKATASRRVRDAVKNGWLVNNESRPYQTADLDVGEPLPSAEGLPDPELLGS